LPPIFAKHRFVLYLALNAAFALLVGVACAVGAFPNPRVLHLILLFALCSSVVIDIDSLNGRHALLALFMLVYFVSYGVGDLNDLFTSGMSGEIPGPAAAPRAEGLLSKTEAVILLGGVLLVLGYRLAVFAVGAARPISQARDWSKTTILIIGPLLWATGTYATYRWNVYIINDTTNESIRKGLGSISAATASMYILAQMMQPLGILLLAYALRVFDNSMLLPLVVGVVILQMMLGFVVDIKGMAMLGGILVIMTTVLVDGRLPKAWLAAFALFVVFMFPVFQAYRTAIHGERGLARTAVIENFGKVVELTLAAETRVNTGRDRAQTFLERSSLKGSTAVIVENTGNGVDYQRGHTLSPILATFVPKVIWSGKKEVPTGQLVNKSFHLTDSDDIFISPSNLGELYWNFGWPGVVIGMSLIGAICGWVGARFNLLEFRTVTRILITVVTIKQLIVGFEGAIAPGYVVWLRSIAGIGLLHLIFARVPVTSRRIIDAAPGTRDVDAPPAGRLYPNLLT
jgi:O-antigen polysaccharide polymerase Wzy